MGITAAAVIFGRHITALFISSDSVQLAAEANQIAYDYLLVMSLFLSILYLLHVFMSALQGMGDGLSPMYAGIIELILRVAIAFTMGYLGFAYGIFFTEVAAWAGGCGFAFYKYRCN